MTFLFTTHAFKASMFDGSFIFFTLLTFQFILFLLLTMDLLLIVHISYSCIEFIFLITYHQQIIIIFTFSHDQPWITIRHCPL